MAGLLDQYFLSDRHDALLIHAIEASGGAFRSVGRSRVRSRENAYRARWQHVGCCSTKFAADLRVHDAPFFGSNED